MAEVLSKLKGFIPYSMASSIGQKSLVEGANEQADKKGEDAPEVQKEN